MLFARLQSLLTQATDAALKKRGSDVACPPFDITLPPAKVSGDVASNAALMLAKTLGASPRSIAEDIIAALPKGGLIEKADIAGAGFVNVWLAPSAFQEELDDIFKDARPAVAPKKFLFEFVSANPTGPLHVGHGRGAALGDSLVRIFRYLGHKVESEFYVNDSGGQIRNLGLSVEARLKELKGEVVPFPENGYQGEYVIEIAKEIIASGRALATVETTQMVFSENDLAGYASAKNLAVIQNTLRDFGVHFDHWYFESSLHRKNAVVKFIDALRAKDLAYDQDGATWFRASQFGDEKDRVLKKANEAPTYFAADLAYHHDKFSRGFDTYVNIWGADHHGYAQRLKGALNAIGEDAGKLEVLFNQMISIKGGRMSKRAGNVITLQEVVEEVGRDATRFFFALRSPGAHFEFDVDLAKKQANDNPVYYVQYLHARCCSIEREAAKREWTGQGGNGFILAPQEKDVVLCLAQFDRIVEKCAADYSNHHLTVYLQELAGRFHSFYEHCHVLVDDQPTRTFRLALVKAIRRRVAQGLDLLGVSAPEQL
jgi:arginyl-tRNA synthetase